MVSGKLLYVMYMYMYMFVCMSGGLVFLLVPKMHQRLEKSISDQTCVCGFCIGLS